MKDLFGSYLAHLAIMVANFATGVLAARLLLPVGRGELGEVMLWPVLLGGLGALAIEDAVIYFSAQGRDAARVFSSASLLGGTLGLALFGIGLAIVPWVYADAREEVHGAVAIYLLSIPVGFVGLNAVALFQGKLRFGIWNFLRSLPIVGYAAFIVAFWAAGRVSVTSFTVASLLALLATLIVGLALMIPRGWLRWRPSWTLMKDMLHYGGRSHPGVVLRLLNQRLDQIVITQWLPAADFGYYLVAFGLAGGATGFVTILGGLAFPKMAARETDLEKVDVLGRYVRLAGLMAIPGTVALIVLAPWLIELIFTDKYRPSIPVLRILALTVLPITGTGLFAETFKAFGRPQVIGRLMVVVVAIHGLAQVVLTTWLGLHGAAWASVVGHSASCLLLALVARSTFGFSLRAMVRPRKEDWNQLAGMLRQLRG